MSISVRVYIIVIQGEKSTMLNSPQIHVSGQALFCKVFSAHKIKSMGNLFCTRALTDSCSESFYMSSKMCVSD